MGIWNFTNRAGAIASIVSFVMSCVTGFGVGTKLAPHNPLETWSVLPTLVSLGVAILLFWLAIVPCAPLWEKAQEKNQYVWYKRYWWPVVVSMLTCILFVGLWGAFNCYVLPKLAVAVGIDGHNPPVTISQGDHRPRPATNP
jgi:hypothetical protein